MIHMHNIRRFSAQTCSQQQQILRIQARSGAAGAADKGRKWRFNSAADFAWFFLQQTDTDIGSYHNKHSWHHCHCSSEPTFSVWGICFLLVWHFFTYCVICVHVHLWSSVHVWKQLNMLSVETFSSARLKTDCVRVCVCMRERDRIIMKWFQCVDQYCFEHFHLILFIQLYYW